MSQDNESTSNCSTNSILSLSAQVVIMMSDPPHIFAATVFTKWKDNGAPSYMKAILWGC